MHVRTYIVDAMEGAAMRKLTLSMDDDAYESIKTLPRTMNISKLVRHTIKANTLTEAQWSVYRRTPEGKEGIEFFRPMKERLYGKKK